MSLKKKHIKIIREAEITGQLFTGFNHRDHRTKAMPSGSKKTFNRKKERMQELKEQELNQELDKIL